MTAGDHEMPPHLVRYVASLSDPVAAADDGPRLKITPGYDVGQYLASARTEAAPAAPAPASEAIHADGHVDQAAAARWHRAQTELVGLIRAEGRTLAANPDAAPVLPDSLADWMEQRVSQLEQAEPEIG
jgi:hypothetical protein